MRFSKDCIIGKLYRLWQQISALRIPIFAAHACYFIVLALPPALLVFLEILRSLPMDASSLVSYLSGVLPDAFLEIAEELIHSAHTERSSALLGFSALTTLWSSSRGLYGILTGLNAIYGVRESRGYLVTRLLSTVYTLAFLAVLLLTLGLQVFLSGILTMLVRLSPPFLQVLLEIVDFRFFLLLLLQVCVFTLMFMVLPNQRNSLRDSIPGALLASCGWLIFSDLFSLYVEHFSFASRMYSPLATLALGMLWLYWCICIVFYGGALNVILKNRG